MQSISTLLKDLKTFYKKEARGHLPWRKTRDPYKILVSEVMLQQTQVERVIPFYNKFIKKFPTPKAFAKATLSDVLKEWQGLGYNRRAKFLHEAAKIITEEGFTGQKLPGVGPYTQGAVLAFAFNRSEVFIETNIRTVFFHYFFNRRAPSATDAEGALLQIADSEILPLVEEALKKSKMEPRDFYAALMDYGSYLKQNGVKVNSRSKHYVKQSKFEGSARQLRGAILRELFKKPATLIQLEKNLSPRTRREIARELERLKKEGLLKKRSVNFEVV
ncbi:MAG TPA: A/G-specific adenine glycosylase [Candidatus Paceibacterota bacterium]|nr:A/G-specific adenine glycosylase [Candidatus Paceibacterota bacterium]